MITYQQILTIIPTYNESENVEILLDKIFSLLPGISVLIIDDNSPDKTSQKIEILQNKYPNLYLITRKCKFGIGSAYIEGFNYALKMEFKAIIQMDADLSHSASDIPKMLSLLDKYDMIIGSRYIKNGGHLNWDFKRAILSQIANSIIKFLLRVPVNDLTSGFKVFKRTVLENIDFPKINSNGYVFQIETKFYAFQKKIRIFEYPIIFHGRKNGKSKMSLSIIFEAIHKIALLSLRKIGIC